MAGMLTEEPAPLSEPGAWSDAWPRANRILSLPEPTLPPERSFLDVLQTRHSSIGGPVHIHEVADLLWYVMAPTPTGVGRAGIATEHRPYPTAGGLHCVRVLLINSDHQLVALYEPTDHRLHVIDAPGLATANDLDVAALLGHRSGCSLRLVGDLAKAQAAYTSPETLLLREAGGLAATIGLCAEWLGLAACPLGSLGTGLLAALGPPQGQLVGVGGIQIGSRSYDR